MHLKHGLEPREYNSGGGFAAQYVRDKAPPSPEQYAHAVIDSLREALDREGLAEPMLFVEPGRPLVARAAVALYTVGARKELPGIRTYVSVDGGMGDNVRPAMYDARYEALVANRVNDEPSDRVTIAGKYCESGDVLIRDIDLPKLEAGDILALPAAGAYCIPMASNYNMSLRPALVSVRNGHATVVRRRETYEDLLATDVWGE
jgi:diaminopimelate decarboxylase